MWTVLHSYMWMAYSTEVQNSQSFKFASIIRRYGVA
jgi:hypothetical protein